MNYEDRILVQLADADSRSALFDGDSLARIAAAGYNTDLLSLEAPFRAVFDSVEVGFFTPRLGVVEGSWQQVGRPRINDARFRFSGFGPDLGARVDAFWRGAVIANGVVETAHIVQAKTAWPSLGTIDAEIASALGALPVEPARETERRTRLLTKLRAGLDQHEAFDDDTFDRWLSGVGAVSVGDLLTRFHGVVLPGSVSVAFSPPSEEPPSPVVLPVAAPVLIRDAGLSISQLLSESKQVREQVDLKGMPPLPDLNLPARRQSLVVWVVPGSVFDDEDWPGAAGGMSAAQSRVARIASASKWLTAEGIGVVVTA